MLVSLCSSPWPHDAGRSAHLPVSPCSRFWHLYGIASSRPGGTTPATSPRCWTINKTAPATKALTSMYPTASTFTKSRTTRAALPLRAMAAHASASPEWDPNQSPSAANVSQPGKLVLKLFNYPAWKVEVNGHLVQTGTRKVTGQMVIPVEAGDNQVQITFARTRDREIGGLISFVTVILILGTAALSSGAAIFHHHDSRPHRHHEPGQAPRLRRSRVAPRESRSNLCPISLPFPPPSRTVSPSKPTPARKPNTTAHTPREKSFSPTTPASKSRRAGRRSRRPLRPLCRRPASPGRK